LVDDPVALARAERKLAASEESGDAEEESDEPREYTWKVLLCECNDRTEAWQIRQALKRHGIESWIEPDRGYSVDSPQVVVAADQLEEAQRAIAQPIPQDIIDESQTEIPEFEMPKCPKCGAADPVLVNAEPSNAWECASCGHHWADAVDESNEP
jgi:ribosomal protein S27AE